MPRALDFLEVISWPLLLFSGLVAYVASTWLLMALRRFNATRYLPRAYWSCALFARAGDFALVIAALIRLVAFVALFPLLYTLIFRRLGSAQVLAGAAIGAVHGLLVGLLLPLAARRCQGSRAPGLFGWYLGRATPLVLLLVHATYGAIIGYIYVLPTP